MCGDARAIRACGGSRRILAYLLALITSLLATASAGAADWQGPLPLSQSGARLSYAVPAVNAAGDAAALSRDDQGGNRLALIRRPAGGEWSAPVTVAVLEPFSQLDYLIGIDGAGTVTVVYTLDGTTNVVTWPMGAPLPSQAALPTTVPFSRQPRRRRYRRRRLRRREQCERCQPTGGDRRLPESCGRRLRATQLRRARSFGHLPPDGGDQRDRHGDRGLQFGCRACARPHAVRRLGCRARDRRWQHARQRRQRRGAGRRGNAQVAFTDFTAAPARIVRVVGRPAASGVWGQPADVSSGSAGSFALPPLLSVAATGYAVLAWTQSDGQQASLHLVSGMTNTGAFQPDGELVLANSVASAVVAGADGSAAAAWVASVSQGTVVQLAVRSAGAWSPARTITAPHGDENRVAVSSLATDDNGTYLALGAFDFSGVMLWLYDAGAPVARYPPSRGCSRRELRSCSRLRRPTLVRGRSARVELRRRHVRHGRAGDARLRRARDVPRERERDRRRRQFGCTGGHRCCDQSPGRNHRRELRGHWKPSRATGTLRVAGGVPLVGMIPELMRGSARVRNVPVQLAAGSFACALDLPARLVPGSHRILLCRSIFFRSTARARTARLGAPRKVSCRRRPQPIRTGGAGRHVARSRTIWAMFRSPLRLGQAEADVVTISAGTRTRVRTVV